MKILFLIEELNGGGKERRLVELLKGLSKESRFDLHLALTKNQNDYPEIGDYPITIHKLYGFSNIALVYQYQKLVRKLKPEVVHTWSFKTSFYASILKYFYNFKLVSGFVADTFGFSIASGLIAKALLFRKADVVVSNSKAGLAAYEVPTEKGCVVYNGYDPARISTKRENKLNDLGVTTPLKVVMLANVTRFKNYALFIDVAKQLVAQRDDVSFISIGRISPQFESMVEPYKDNKHSRIKFIGYRDDVSDLIKDCHVGLLCTYTEGISNAVIELMANRLPVVTNDVNGGTKEIIKSGYNGFIVPDSLLLEKVEFLLNHKEEAESLSENAERTVLDHFSLKAMCDSYSRIYRQ